MESIKSFEEFQGSIAKFVPASGAATRMFKSLYEFRSAAGTGVQEDLINASKEVRVFFENLRLFAFYDDLHQVFEKTFRKSIDEALKSNEYISVLKLLLDNEGLEYGSLPKGLLAFHRYGQTTRTPAIEQKIEGFLHVSEQNNFHLHFTVSPEHVDRFQAHLLTNKEEEETIKISYSSQEPSTDKIAVDLSNEIFRDEQGQLLFRPAGHGALLRNLNRIEEDIVFIKNI